MKAAASSFDAATVGAADAVTARAIAAFLDAIGTSRGVIVTAPAGAGKSGLVCRAVGAARKAGRRLAIGSPTNEQALGLVGRLADDYPRQTIAFMPSGALVIPDEVLARKNVRIVDVLGGHPKPATDGHLKTGH